MNVKCPRCRKETQWENNPFRPFCSERCKLIDIGKWVDGEYAIPSEDSADDDSGAEQ